MKTLKLIFLIIIVSLFTGSLKSQVSLGVNIGVPSPRYYYLQDIESYYDNQTSMYIYLSGGRWIHSRSLPASYGNYDLNNSHRVVIRDYNGRRPYNYIREHRVNFPKGRYGEPEKNYWSYKEHRGQGRVNRPPPNRNEDKHLRNEGPGKDNGNNHGNDKGKGPGNENGHGRRK